MTNQYERLVDLVQEAVQAWARSVERRTEQATVVVVVQCEGEEASADAFFDGYPLTRLATTRRMSDG